MAQKNLLVKGAREHNLKNIDIEIPRDKLVVFTGLAGSGKSSLAFDKMCIRDRILSFPPLSVERRCSR